MAWTAVSLLSACSRLDSKAFKHCMSESEDKHWSQELIEDCVRRVELSRGNKKIKDIFIAQLLEVELRLPISISIPIPKNKSVNKVVAVVAATAAASGGPRRSQRLVNKQSSSSWPYPWQTY